MDAGLAMPQRSKPDQWLLVIDCVVFDNGSQEHSKEAYRCITSTRVPISQYSKFVLEHSDSNKLLKSNVGCHGKSQLWKIATWLKMQILTCELSSSTSYRIDIKALKRIRFN